MPRQFTRPLSRRRFLQHSAGAAAALGLGLGRATRALAANEKLNIGVIGTANRAAANIGGVQHENIVALCDIDSNYLGQAAQQFPQAQTYRDFRALLDQGDLDAVVVSTADHVHVPAAVQAMRRGLHVYCEKPLAHNVWEARLAAQVAAETGRATQMGTQVHAESNYRRVVELIQTGAIGPVREVHVWCGKSWSGGERPTDTPPVPENIDWDLWLGPAPYRPYHSTYLPANWRRWWDFGSGTLGDMGCHLMDLPFWALGLQHPVRVEASGPPVHPETAPASLFVEYQFPARDEQPELRFCWYDGDYRPPLLAEHKLPAWDMGVLFIGDEGMLQADYGQRLLFPEEKFADYKAPDPFIPESTGHYIEWLTACRDGSPTTCNFGYSGALSEAVLLGTVAYRVGQPLEWDGQKLEATNCPAAAQLVRREYRPGWELA